MAATDVPYDYRCPNLQCRAGYVATLRDHPPEKKPRCDLCNTPFLAMEKGLYIHYQSV